MQNFDPDDIEVKYNKLERRVSVLEQQLQIIMAQPRYAGQIAGGEIRKTPAPEPMPVVHEKKKIILSPGEDTLTSGAPPIKIPPDTSAPYDPSILMRGEE